MGNQRHGFEFTGRVPPSPRADVFLIHRQQPPSRRWTFFFAEQGEGGIGSIDPLPEPERGLASRQGLVLRRAVIMRTLPIRSVAGGFARSHGLSPSLEPQPLTLIFAAFSLNSARMRFVCSWSAIIGPRTGRISTSSNTAAHSFPPSLPIRG